MSATILEGDCVKQLRALAPESVQCVVTSPPYWGLRDYGIGGQLGLEKTPEEYVEKMVGVFREVRRVLRRDGTCWVNMGDSYWNGGTARITAPHLKPKDLVGMPWKLAFALQADGWFLRADVIWAKPNPMPESVTDRPTKAHEYVFLLTKSARYFYDADAVREPHREPWRSGSHENRRMAKGGDGLAFTGWDYNRREYNPAGRNLRSVWTIASEPYPEAHFATFPRKLVEPCIRAGTSAKGACAACGAPWERLIERHLEETRGRVGDRSRDGLDVTRTDAGSQWGHSGGIYGRYRTKTTGWRPSCDCGDGAGTKPCVVLDPFAGTGTVGIVAHENGCDSVLVELHPEYVALMRRRLAPVISQPLLFSPESA